MFLADTLSLYTIPRHRRLSRSDRPRRH
ncbi:hypothetical protein CCACVL1_27117 [Corchorus capsularis]|uniref:Uncharacterized protein n=1 Tax=Corchorus capsularis TaxID=210143 RepID=A0A1R3GC20_COCAP|nr:hypothetical protein CCACVL1_27117 [Corchorus capsularis]